MKNIVPLFLLLSFLPSVLQAETKTITETDLANPIVIHQGDTLILSLTSVRESTWRSIILFKQVVLPSGTNIPPGTAIPTDPLIQDSIKTFNSRTQGSWIETCYSAVALGQEVILFTSVGLDPVYECEKTFCFIVNVEADAVEH